MRWLRPQFFHFRADADELQRRLPAELTLDRYGGDAFISLVSLRVQGPGPLEYEQLNVRTYVSGPDGDGGIWLLDTRVDRRLPALGARLFGMPYHVERPLIAPLDAVPEGQWQVATSGLERFLLERYFAFGQLGGSVWAARVEHAPWLIRAARPLGQMPARLAGVRVVGEPACVHVAESVAVSFAEAHLVHERRV